MNSVSVRVYVPATTANLGPGFDCLGLALDLWNETRFTPGGRGLTWDIAGEGAQRLPRTEDNLLWRAFLHGCRAAGAAPPEGIRITCRNGIPIGSGLGSSAAAVLSGLLGAQALAGTQALPLEALLRLAADLEGHPDNAAPALLGGLVLAAGRRARRIEIPLWTVVYALPEARLSTREARLVLPQQIALQDAVFNIGHALLAVEALRSGDLPLLRQAMRDRLHQPFRAALIPGMQAALQAARSAGAAAALSGAGPGLVAFCLPEQAEQTGRAVRAAFQRARVACRLWYTRSTGRGAWTA